MTGHNANLRFVELDHANLDIAFYKKGGQPPIDPTFAMTVDNLTGRAVRCWLEWPEHLPVSVTSFGALVQAAREALCLPLEEVARRIMKTDEQTLSVKYLNAIERGNCLPSSALIPQFAKVLQIPADVLYFSLGRLPSDLLQQERPLGRVVQAFQTLRAELAADSNPCNETDLSAS